MKKFILLLLIISFGTTSCINEEIECDTERTVFMYLPWSTNLTYHFENNVSEMESIVARNVLRNERVIVFFSTSPTKAVMFEITHCRGKSERHTFKEYANPPFTTEAGIISILNDVKRFAPANKYAMIVGCHGLGWIPVSSTLSRSIENKKHWDYKGVPMTRYFGGLTSQFQTNTTTLAKGIIGAGLKMEYILFDDCYLSTVEVAYDLKEATDYLIASPSEIMAYGMPYEKLGAYLFGKVNYRGICDTFLEFYENYSIMPCGTIAVTDCSELDALAAVMKEINRKFNFDTSQEELLQKMDGYTPTLFYDYADYVAKLCPDNALRAKFEIQLERTLPSRYRKHTEHHYTMSKGKIKINTYSGITISDPSTHPDAIITKTQTAWYKATHP